MLEVQSFFFYHKIVKGVDNMVLFNEMLYLFIPLLLCMLVQYFICEWFIDYGRVIPILSLFIIIYKFYTSIVPTIFLHSFNITVVFLHAMMLVLYSSFFMTSFSIYLIKKPKNK